MDRKYDVAVIGAGPAGQMAALTAAGAGLAVCLLERKSQPGKKLLMTGGGRCNLTSSLSVEEILAHMPRGSQFLQSALRQFDNQALLDFFEKRGLDFFQEGSRVFPTQGPKALQDCLRAHLQENQVDLRCDTQVQAITPQAQGFYLQTSQAPIVCQAVVVASGGQSYPATGSDGKMFAVLESLGIHLISRRPALTGVALQKPWPHLAGLSLPYVKASAWRKEKAAQVTKRFLQGALLFTHQGVSGPCILDLTGWMSREEPSAIGLAIDFLPDVEESELYRWSSRSFKELSGFLRAYLPQRLITELLLPWQTTDFGNLPKKSKQEMVSTLKSHLVTLTAFGKLAESIAVSGGVDLAWVSSSTLMSKQQRGLFFAGECLDVHGLTGGYNLQAAFSTGWLAGQKSAAYIKETNNCY